MEHFFNFLLNHWLLSTAFIIIVFLLLISEFFNNFKSIAQLSPTEVTAKMNHQEAVIIDVRPVDKFKQGHIIGAINITAVDVDKHIDKLKAFGAKPLVVVCDTGQTSATIGSLLKKQGFNQTFCLNGGLNAWRSASLPLVKK